ncbi:ergothioneine biosynthesis protein EgtB [Marinihelvus fidelis]|uniref:Ergothioneine biosynthesis protein EgtB n=1 Tax=Marinihelvus fidelis TaxID=2613842 RepID=A0A5N0T3W5_9GAMM|nr:ergothioneine biosynthesis protein EgtB [Marinihelvus fidelis]KAA9129755.1 ergothioneine biosynthesis protein EgtB [Marinihelvus fidelis]
MPQPKPTRTQTLADPTTLLAQYQTTRAHTEALAAPLSPEDQMIQSMPDASPTKWHLGHTTWFFETFVLCEHKKGHTPFDEAHKVLFNSYYNGVGEQYPRPKRGMMSRPPLERVMEWRQATDQAMEELLTQASQEQMKAIAPLVTLGIHHEQQHQELLLTDIKHGLWQNPTWPAMFNHDAPAPAAPTKDDTTNAWQTLPEGQYTIGHQGEGFAFDNEGPAHTVHLQAAQLATHPVTNHEWLQFMEDGGYNNALLWLSDGWAWRQQHGITTPLYWRKAEDGQWRHFTLRGDQPLPGAEPVTHISYYEADAYARWQGKRLPTEFEWEATRPKNVTNWEWTASAYAPYPGYQPSKGAVGEYNGKFMINQMVLKGKSGATAPNHSRPSYRNFFYPDARWQFTGLRLAQTPT